MKHRLSLWIAVLVIASLACNFITGAVEKNAPQEQAPVPGQEEQGDAAPAPAGASGLMTLDLEDPALAAAYTSSVVQHFVISYSGVDAAGSPLVVMWTIDYTEQLEPQPYLLEFQEKTRNGDAYEGKNWAVIEGQYYGVDEQGCPQREDTLERKPSNQQAARVGELEGKAN